MTVRLTLAVLAFAPVLAGCRACPERDPTFAESAALDVVEGTERTPTPFATATGLEAEGLGAVAAASPLPPLLFDRATGDVYGSPLGLLVFTGYSASLHVEGDAGGRASLCFSWVTDTGDDAAPNGCFHDWRCAVGGTVTRAIDGGILLHAVFEHGGTIDGAYAVTGR